MDNEYDDVYEFEEISEASLRHELSKGFEAPLLMFLLPEEENKRSSVSRQELKHLMAKSRLSVG